MLLKPFDMCIVVPAFAAVVFSFFAVYSGGSGSPEVKLRADGGRWVFPVSSNETVNVSGPLGDTVIEIRDGGARVVSSPCPDQLCIAKGVVRERGQWTACLPNRVMLYIGETAGEGYDGSDLTAW